MIKKITIDNNFRNDYRIQQGSFLILSLFFLSHGIFHFMSHSFSVMLPLVKNTFGINPVQVGFIFTVKELTAGLAALPGGVVSDYLRRYRMLLMAICMAIFGAGWLAIGLSQIYGILLVGMVILAAANSIWHLPSVAELGILFEHKRGAALSIHGAGGSLGDILGPVVTGLLLGAISWQSIICIYAFIPIMMSLWAVWVFLRRGRAPSNIAESASEEKKELKTQLKIARNTLKRTHILRVNLVAGFRGMCFVALVAFLPLYMKDNLGLSSKSVGFHFGLLWTMGIIVSPIMGHLSDRWDRKLVLVPTLVYSSLLLVLLALIGNGAAFTILFVLLGISLRSDYSLVNATILDITGDQAVTTMLGILQSTRFVMGAVSPLIAGAIYQYAGMKTMLLFAAVLYIFSAIIFSSINLNKS